MWHNANYTILKIQTVPPRIWEVEVRVADLQVKTQILPNREATEVEILTYQKGKEKIIKTEEAA